MSLFLVDRLMYRECSEVFYSHVCFNFYSDDLSPTGPTFSVLRRLPLKRLRRLQFTMTVAQCDGWNDPKASAALACGYPESEFRQVAQYLSLGWDGQGMRPDHLQRDWRADWRALVAFLAEHADLPQLSLTVDMAACGWALVEIPDLMMSEEWGQPGYLNMFRFVYDFCMGVVSDLFPLGRSGLGAICLDLYPFTRLRRWLEREVMGCGSLEQPGRLGPGTGIPKWHNMDQRLEGSNYSPAS